MKILNTFTNFVEFYHVAGPDHYVSLGGIQTAPGSNNEVLSSSLNRRYTTVPPQGGNPSEIYVYEVE